MPFPRIDFLFWKWRILRGLSDSLEHFPRIYRFALVIKNSNRPFLRRIITRRHDLTIEGYPRSGNTFAVLAVLFNNGWRDLRIATHSHSLAQVYLSSEWRIPCLVMIRKPSEAIPSLIALGVHGDVSEKHLENVVKYEIKRYIRFYDNVRRVNSSKQILIDFSVVEKDFNVAVKALKDICDRPITEFEHKPENINTIFNNSGDHATPSSLRATRKQLVQSIYFSDKNFELRKKAESIYAALKAQALVCPDT